MADPPAALNPPATLDEAGHQQILPSCLCCAAVEVTTGRAPVDPRVIDELAPDARHVLEQYAKNLVEADYRRRKARLRPMRVVKRARSAATISGHAFMQNLHGGH